jgi:muramoyltetrapeptide carboxypeptidase LdcA involved in peptidoglycan recycling
MVKTDSYNTINIYLRIFMSRTIEPCPLKSGDTIKVLSPSLSLSIVSEEIQLVARQRLALWGINICESMHARESDKFSSSSIASRVDDLHEAFANPNVRGICTSIGGYNSNQILAHLDYNLIHNNPKIVCGYSDITALTNAIYAQTGLVTFNGPHFSTFGCLDGIDYILDYYYSALFTRKPIKVRPADKWSDDSWYIDQHNRTYSIHTGPWIIKQGEASGISIGGNLSTLNLLQGTPYMPCLQNSIMFLEEEGAALPALFDQRLQSLAQQYDFSSVKAVLIGRFERCSHMTYELLSEIIKSKKELNHCVVIANLDFGHTMPFFTFPIGLPAYVEARAGEIKLILRTKTNL